MSFSPDLDLNLPKTQQYLKTQPIFNHVVITNKMRIIGFNLTRILVQKEEEQKSNLEVNQNINIKSVSEEKIPISTDKALKVTFNLTINYSNEYAKLEFEGQVLILTENNEFKEFIDNWKSKKIPEKFRIVLFNFIMNKCNIKALYLEDEMNLPFHVPMPRLSQENQRKKN